MYNKAYLSLSFGQSPLANHYIRVQPDDVSRKPLMISDKFLDTGKVKGGDWDLNGEVFGPQEITFSSVHDVLEGKPWEKTPLFVKGLKGIQEGQTAFGVANEEELRERGRRILNLAKNIQTNGYREPQNAVFVMGNSDEIAVHIGRDGEILFADGGHRLAIAKILGIDSVPAQVSVRHSEWDSLRRKLILAAQNDGGQLYQRVPHPDLDVIPFTHDCSARVEILKPHIDEFSGILLDIGANIGMMCHLMTALGFQCVAIENDPMRLDLIRELQKIFQVEFQIFGDSFLNFSMDRFKEIEIILALNIFHHFLKTKETHDELAVVLENISAKTIFFEPHMQSELEGLDPFRNYGEREFSEFVQERSGLSNCLLIGRAKDGRALFKIW